MPTHFFEKLGVIGAHLSEINIYAILLGLMTFLLTKYILKVSVFIPAPLVALAVTSVLAATVWSGKGLSLISDKYGKIPTDFFIFTPPAALKLTPEFLGDLAYYVVAIVIVAAIESLLCSRMADRLADNRGLPFNPNKELWGQGLVQIVVPLLNGFPHTGALARTATNIKLGAVSPLAGIFKAVLKYCWRFSWNGTRSSTHGLHRRHSAVCIHRHGEACRGQAGAGTQSVPYFLDDLYGRRW